MSPGTDGSGRCATLAGELARRAVREAASCSSRRRCSGASSAGCASASDGCPAPDEVVTLAGRVSTSDRRAGSVYASDGRCRAWRLRCRRGRSSAPPRVRQGYGNHDQARQEDHGQCRSRWLAHVMSPPELKAVGAPARESHGRWGAQPWSGGLPSGREVARVIGRSSGVQREASASGPMVVGGLLEAGAVTARCGLATVMPWTTTLPPTSLLPS